MHLTEPTRHKLGPLRKRKQQIAAANATRRLHNERVARRRQLAQRDYCLLLTYLGVELPAAERCQLLKQMSVVEFEAYCTAYRPPTAKQRRGLPGDVNAWLQTHPHFKKLFFRFYETGYATSDLALADWWKERSHYLEDVEYSISGISSFIHYAVTDGLFPIETTLMLEQTSEALPVPNVEEPETVVSAQSVASKPAAKPDPIGDCVVAVACALSVLASLALMIFGWEG